MGAAKRRGTREERVAQAVVRAENDFVAIRDKLEKDAAAERARVLALPVEERKTIIFAAGGDRLRGLRMATMLALAGGASFAVKPRDL